jgi:hypothetical protein
MARPAADEKQRFPRRRRDRKSTKLKVKFAVNAWPDACEHVVSNRNIFHPENMTTA